MRWKQESSGLPAIDVAGRFEWIIDNGQITGYRPARAKWLVKKREREGWIVQLKDGVALAHKRVQMPLAAFPPPEYHWKDQGSFILILGGSSSPEEWLKAPLWASVRWAAEHLRFYPGMQLVPWLAMKGVSVAYSTSVTQEQRNAVVIIGSLRLDLQQLRLTGEIEEIRHSVESES